MKFQIQYPLEHPNIFQKFGENALALYKDVLHLDGHNGIDMVAGDGTPVYATHDGEVTFAGEDGSSGIGVVIRTLQPFDYKEGQSYFKTIYWHLKSGGVKVTVGQKVKAGELIALSNNTGLSTGPHLHFGLKPIYQGEQAWQWVNAEQTNGYMGAIDPVPYFNGIYPNSVNVPIKKEFLTLMQAVKDFQISEGLNDFANETNLSKIRIGNKTLNALKKYYK